MSGDTRGSTGSGPIERAFLLLQGVAASDQPVGVRELGRRTGIPRSSASRLLATLDKLGMVTRNANGEVVVGSGVASLQPHGGAPEPSLEDRLRPLLLDLVEQFGESAALTVDTPGGAHYLAQVPSRSAVQVPDATGKQYPFHVVAPGLVLMADWDERRLDQYLQGGLEAPTTHAIVDVAMIGRRLVAVAADGCAWTDQEMDLEVNGVAVPVLDADGSLIAAVSLYGPAYRLDPVSRPGLAADLVRAVNARTAIALG